MKASDAAVAGAARSARGFGSLAGLRVLDLGTMIAGPFCTALLADHGADVIKVEQPGLGDPIRSWAPLVGRTSLWWKVIARNKRLITLDLGKPAGQELAKQLIASADVVVENFRPGTLERWGLGYTVMEKVNPGVVLVRISGYGQTGPYSGRPGYGTVAEAMAGIPAFTGFPDRPPQLSAFPLADYVSGVFGAFGAMSAMYQRASSGRGQVIDVSLFEPLFRLVEPLVIGYDTLGLVKKRVGNRLEEDAPRNAYETRDGKYVTVSASSPRTWERFARAIGHPDLLDDPRFVDNASRCENVDALDDIVAAWHRERTLAEVLEVFAAHDVVAGPIYDVRDIVGDPHYEARRAIIELDDEELGRVKMQAAVPKLSRTPGEVRHAGLAQGAHNEEVYLSELGLTEDHYRYLRESGVI